VLIGQGLLARSGALIADACRQGQVRGGHGCQRLRTSSGDAAGCTERSASFAGAEVLAPGEATKSFPVLARLSERLLEMGLERGDLVVALGGGVIGDLAGFAARHLAARHPLRADPDDPVGAGRFPRSAARPASTRRRARTWSARFISRAWCWPTSTLATLPARQFRAG
jgi:shikimate kinase/3-dehydroquinate synthase